MGAIISTFSLKEARGRQLAHPLSLPLPVPPHLAPPLCRGYPSSPSQLRWTSRVRGASPTFPRYSNVQVPGLARACQTIYLRPPQQGPVDPSLAEEAGPAAPTIYSVMIWRASHSSFLLFLPCRPVTTPLLPGPQHTPWECAVKMAFHD